MLSLFATLHTFFLSRVDGLRREETGATAVEYTLMVALIAVAIVGVVTAFGQQLSAFFGGLGAQLGL
ncbi:Flp family type IVb pilin [Paenarthrobacter sp. DKR-5]|uniref:Flp family type IVb pilin n=1 Tax=Paenarthrobacter sp. DKR-5 TaxID=2835535 RepID=UPI001BDC4FB6|nr:Flp family type IVb pilin [Paenarthrobacter sp. DKR-5]MBT1001588.1 Flp family type IVb pilin [Paenarthrobacter sp. DKR-5]